MKEAVNERSFVGTCKHTIIAKILKKKTTRLPLLSVERAT